MAGHSAWANIQHRKGRQDEKRSKVWTKIIKEINVAAKIGGADIAANPRLRVAIEKAKSQNMPADNIKRAVDKGAGLTEGADYIEIRYEGYGVNGVAVIVDTLTDNRQRTVAEVRHAFSKHGGSLGTDGSVAFMFKHCGQFFFAPLEGGGSNNEDALMEAALDAGAEDILTDEDGSIELMCAPADFADVKAALEAKGFHAVIADIVMKPLNPVEIAGDEAAKMQKIIDMLEDQDDVQSVYTSAVFQN